MAARKISGMPGDVPSPADLIPYVDVANGRNEHTTLSDLAEAIGVEQAGVYLGDGNYISCADAAGIDITGDLTVVAWVAADDWSPAAQMDIASKWNGSGNQRSWRFFITTAGALSFAWSTNGVATAATVVSTDNLSALAAGAIRFVAVTFDVDNGASGNTARFWTSTDGTAWTQLGSDVVTAIATSIFVSTVPLEFGSFGAGGGTEWAGKVYSLSVRSGVGASGAVGGTEVAYWPANIARLSRFRDAYGNIWTPAGSPSVMEAPDPF